MTHSTAALGHQAPIVRTLSEKIDHVLSDLITPDEPFALLDFPDHWNIGDSAIYHGEMAYLKKRGMFPSFVCTTKDYNWDTMDSRVGNGQILLHGGGNFGDVWPDYQTFREEVLKRYPGRPVVQFPQTIFYGSQDRIDETARIIERHGAYTLLVRDQRSLDLASKSFQCEIRLCPDMAFKIDPVRSRVPSNDLLIHLRRDKEATEEYDTGNITTYINVMREDWPLESKELLSRIDQTSFPAKAFAYLKHGRSGVRPTHYAKRAEARFLRGVKMLQQNQLVITNRLHGHIMCLLLGIRHCVIDNNYGKISGYMETWGTHGPFAFTASDVEQAVDVLNREAGLQLKNE